jgi:signal transduction histidine kinase
MRLNRTNVDMHQLVQSVIDNFSAIATQKNQSLISQFSDTLTDSVLIDETLIYRVLDNLLSNAIKFSPVDSSIVVKVDNGQADTVTIQVIDSGPGVPGELRQQIFEKYEIGTLMPNVSQIGLGLALCKMIVKAHQGEICVKSNQPKGSIFEVTLSQVPPFPEVG